MWDQLKFGLVYRPTCNNTTETVGLYLPLKRFEAFREESLIVYGSLYGFVVLLQDCVLN